ncbi:hypothetical protein JOC85_003724 [Bacillus mesophilus]|uniref:DUF4085 family protein n=1 Tax=Bacillus mesophilus TaxID=1808955 RepID=A0A6M0QB13_9BACI|nr:DUF4085 family protein [Bacillus mesophilus]MBM7662913.1 hypothetical protein [Bacillus mesophilus]NEY73502.1 DUF4085 family protein [Bacillus mesophilus]
MWNISKEAKERFLKHNLLPIHESDREWEISLREAREEGEDLITSLQEELAEVKEELLQVLPSRFVPYLEDGSLNQPTLPKSVLEDYLNWIQQASHDFEQVLDAAYERTQHALPYLPTSVQEVFAESLHDSTIERIVWEGDTLHLYVNTDGGFSSKALIHFTFKGVQSEETDGPIEVGQWFIYDELQKTEDGFAFRVLFESPESQWTISMKELDAEYFYRPKEYTILRNEEKLEDTSLVEYTSSLNPEHRYWLITPHIECTISSFSENLAIENGLIEFSNNELVVIVGNERFTYDLDEYNPIQFIYTYIYEDPYAQFNEPIPTEEIEEAALGEELELQVRAWNTMYGNPKELANIINTVLMKVNVTEENEMMISVYVNHFYKEGILLKEVIEKHRACID